MHPLRKGRNAVYSSEASELRSKLRQWIKARLAKHTGDKSAAMWWTLHTYHRYVYVRRRLRLVGWPETVPFRNLSMLTMADLLELRDRWRTKALRFEPVSEEDWYKNAHHPERVAPAERYDEGGPRLGRDDVKKSRVDHDSGLPVSRMRKWRPRGPKTPKIVREG